MLYTVLQATTTTTTTKKPKNGGECVFNVHINHNYFNNIMSNLTPQVYKLSREKKMKYDFFYFNLRFAKISNA